MHSLEVVNSVVMVLGRADLWDAEILDEFVLGKKLGAGTPAPVWSGESGVKCYIF